jgi:hypothetical protein
VWDKNISALTKLLLYVHDSVPAVCTGATLARCGSAPIDWHIIPERWDICLTKIVCSNSTIVGMWPYPSHQSNPCTDAGKTVVVVAAPGVTVT